MKEFVEFVVKGLVDHPDEVQVREVDGDHGTTVLELSVASQDMGRVIGKGGRVINSIRSLVQVASAKKGEKVNLELLEADGR